MIVDEDDWFDWHRFWRRFDARSTIVNRADIVWLAEGFAEAISSNTAIDVWLEAAFVEADGGLVLLPEGRGPGWCRALTEDAVACMNSARIGDVICGVHQAKRDRYEARKAREDAQ